MAALLKTACVTALVNWVMSAPVPNPLLLNPARRNTNNIPDRSEADQQQSLTFSPPDAHQPVFQLICSAISPSSQIQINNFFGFQGMTALHNIQPTVYGALPSNSMKKVKEPHNIIQQTLTSSRAEEILNTKEDQSIDPDLLISIFGRSKSSDNLLVKDGDGAHTGNNKNTESSFAQIREVSKDSIRKSSTEIQTPGGKPLMLAMKDNGKLSTDNKNSDEKETKIEDFKEHSSMHDDMLSKEDNNFSSETHQKSEEDNSMATPTEGDSNETINASKTQENNKGGSQTMQESEENEKRNEKNEVFEDSSKLSKHDLPDFSLENRHNSEKEQTSLTAEEEHEISTVEESGGTLKNQQSNLSEDAIQSEEDTVQTHLSPENHLSKQNQEEETSLSAKADRELLRNQKNITQTLFRSENHHINENSSHEEETSLLADEDHDKSKDFSEAFETRSSNDAILESDNRNNGKLQLKDDDTSRAPDEEQDLPKSVENESPPQASSLLRADRDKIEDAVLYFKNEDIGSVDLDDIKSIEDDSSSDLENHVEKLTRRRLEGDDQSTEELSDDGEKVNEDIDAMLPKAGNANLDSIESNEQDFDKTKKNINIATLLTDLKDSNGESNVHQSGDQLQKEVDEVTEGAEQEDVKENEDGTKVHLSEKDLADEDNFEESSTSDHAIQLSSKEEKDVYFLENDDTNNKSLDDDEEKLEYPASDADFTSEGRSVFDDSGPLPEVEDAVELSADGGDK